MFLFSLYIFRKFLHFVRKESYLDMDKRKDVQIFSLCYEKKDWDFLNDSVITPLQVGAANGTDVCELKDNTKENISNGNFFYVENTGLFWIWKNVKDAKYKGQMQYRRPLSGVSETMDFDKTFEEYDVITCKPFNHPENSKPKNEGDPFIPANTVEQGYAYSNCGDDIAMLSYVIKKIHPDYAEDYDKYIRNGENLYYSNGFILRSEDYDRYCDFLFSCLNGWLQVAGIQNQFDLWVHVARDLGAGKYIRYKNPYEAPTSAVMWQTRIGGFLSERIWTLWLLHNFSEDRILELEYIKMEPDKMYT